MFIFLFFFLRGSRNIYLFNSTILGITLYLLLLQSYWIKVDSFEVFFYLFLLKGKTRVRQFQQDMNTIIQFYFINDVFNLGYWFFKKC